jgi:hypothetical protein
MRPSKAAPTSSRTHVAPVGMDDAGTAAQSAILLSSAVGHFPDLATGGARRTDLFVLPDSWALHMLSLIYSAGVRACPYDCPGAPAL